MQSETLLAKSGFKIEPSLEGGFLMVTPFLFLYSGRSFYLYLYVVYHTCISGRISGTSELISQQEFLLQLCKKLQMLTHLN